MKTKTIPNRESRFLSASVELRAAADEESKPIVRGYAAKFDVESELLTSKNGDFRETIARGAFDDVLNGDVRALFNHDPNIVLARSKNGTGSLSLGVDDVGLWYEFESPDTQAGRDLTESIRRGDIDSSSFGFAKREDKWEKRDGIIYRTITKIAELFDVSPVTHPAYPDATVALRSLQEFRKEEEPETPEPAPEDHSLSYWQQRMGLISKPAESQNKTENE